jgi:hypothetical protein
LGSFAKKVLRVRPVLRENGRPDLLENCADGGPSQLRLTGDFADEVVFNL